MEFHEAKQNLIELLCVGIEELSHDELRKLVKKRYKLWHPDKNKDDPERYTGNFIKLNESYKVYMKGPDCMEDSGNASEPTPGPSAEDIFCDEQWDPNWDPDSEESDYNSTPFDDEFFNASPKKNFAVPESLRLFFRAKTNRRAGKIFMIFTFRDNLHRKLIESFANNTNTVKTFYIWSARTNKDIYCCLLVTCIECRLLDIKKQIKKASINTSELFYAVNLFKLFEKLNELYSEPEFSYGEKIQKKTTVENNFIPKQLVDFALSHEYNDVFTLMYEYAHLADPCDRTECSKDHEDDHSNEIINAKKFVNLPDRKRVCKNAIDCVMAKLYRQLTCVSNTQWLEMRSRDFSDRLIEATNCDLFGRAYYYYKYILGLELFREIFRFVIAKFTDTVYSAPDFLKNQKKRFIVLRGNYDCGKTTLGAAICKFFEGVNININVTRDRLPFYIGCALGKRFVLLDDVKGYRTKVPKLPVGNGISNLDDMREHLDGKIEVQLEKKNLQPIEQKFPTGIITMNKYEIPGSLLPRLKIIDMKPCKLYDKHHYPVTMDTIFVAMALDNLIPCTSSFISWATKKKDEWFHKHIAECNCMVSNLVFSFMVYGWCYFCSRCCRCCY